MEKSKLVRIAQNIGRALVFSGALATAPIVYAQPNSAIKYENERARQDITIATDVIYGSNYFDNNGNSIVSVNVSKSYDKNGGSITYSPSTLLTPAEISEIPGYDKTYEELAEKASVNGIVSEKKAENEAWIVLSDTYNRQNRGKK